MKTHVNLNIAFFVGSDLASHLILNKTVKILIKDGIRPYVFFIPQSLNSSALPGLKELFFYERQLLNDYVYPFIDRQKRASESAQLLTIRQFRKLYGNKLHVQILANVNDAEFLRFLEKNRITAGVSIRCYQKFSQEIIDYFNKKIAILHQPFFVNLHPGLLPEYRGVTTYCRAMQNQEKKAGFTLHFIDQYWDAGPIISKDPQPLDYSLSVVENMCLHVDSASTLLISVIQKLSFGKMIKSKEQKKGKSAYYSHATKSDFIDFRKKKIKLVRPKQIMDLIFKKYLSLDEKETKKLMHSKPNFYAQ